jgi:hypothetical protein
MSVQYAILNELKTIPKEIVDLAQRDMAHPSELVENEIEQKGTMKQARRLKNEQRAEV